MSTGVLRFDFQIGAAAHASGFVLNVGCNEDPAQLRDRFGSRVINCDLEAFDETMNRPNLVDKIFDMTERPWPFDDDYAEVVIMGDVLEHMPFNIIVDCMREARRVGREMCVTVPEDHRIDPEAVKSWKKGAYNPHVTVITEQVLRDALSQSGWTPYLFIKGDWGFMDGDKPVQGWCAMCHRSVNV